MTALTSSVYQYVCRSCSHRFEVETTFEPIESACDSIPPGADSAGYPEQQPACPSCHSQEVTRIEVRHADPLPFMTNVNPASDTPHTPHPPRTPYTPYGEVAMPPVATAPLKDVSTNASSPSASTAPTIETTVGELVAQRPARSRLFEKLGIDYCCGGRKPLSELCAAKGLDAHTVLRQVLAADNEDDADAGDQSNWSSASLTALADHVEQTHHAYLKRELPRLGRMVRKVAAVHGDYHPWMLEVDGVYAAFAAEMESHLMKEEHVLFPLIRCLENPDATPPERSSQCGPGVDKPIQVMEHEHDDAGRALTRMRELSNGYSPPPDACNTFRAMLDGLREIEADTHRHVHKENSILFPRAIEREQQAR